MNKAALWIAFAALMPAQADKRVEFEVASIKPTATKDGSLAQSFPPGGRFSCRNLSVRDLLRIAFDLQGYQIAGGPGWIGSEGFDIQARATAGVGEPSRGQVLKMLQTLLADRFRLAFHREIRQLPIYTLAIRKGGHKLQAADSTASTDGTFRMGHLVTRKMSMTGLAGLLTFDLKRPVTDETGLKGDFAFTLEWTPGLGEADEGPSLFVAVQEQLGLILESKKGPLEVLLIDHVERPAEN